MMKRNILAVIIPAILVAGSVNAAEIYNKDGNKLDFYGKVVGERGFNTQTADKDKGTKKGSSDASYAQIGFKGETQINSDLVGFGRWEYRAKASKEEGNQDNVTRLAFAGIKAGEAGSLSYGRNHGIVYDVESYTDMSPSFSGETWGGSTDNFMNNRTTGVLTYRNTDFFGHVEGLNFGIQFQGKNDRDNATKSNGEGVGYSAEYNFAEGFALTGAYSNSNRTSKQKTVLGNEAKHAEAWAVGGKYDANNIYLAAVYAETRNMSNVANGMTGTDIAARKTQNIELIAQYQFDFGLRPSLAFVHSKGKGLNLDSANKDVSADLAKYIQVGSSYYFNKNFNVYADYRVNLLSTSEAEKTDGGWVGSDNQGVVGVAYQF
ncbi:porin [uncultured Cedecea sp.]|uniref:porin n=1 Tax=uncultured Cedecea sp. TaxID=988762 RepID=UPI002609E8BE|nr:porin [uncultured Cedecea sp.]